MVYHTNENPRRSKAAGKKQWEYSRLTASGASVLVKEVHVPMKKKAAPTKSAKATSAKRNTKFSYRVKPDAKQVYLVGDFNNWNERTDRMVKHGNAFEKSKQLAPGEYQYKFLVDGEWYPDPAAEKQIPNKYGTLNSVIRVEEAKNE